MVWKKIRIIIVLVLLFFGVAHSETVRIKRFLSSQGFTRNSVSSIIQDDKGFLWIGTPDGLFKYDGYSFEIFKHQLRDKNSLIHSDIQGIHKTSEGDLWVVTKAGLSVYSPDLNKYVNLMGWPYSEINCVLEIQKKTYILGTGDGIFIAKWKNNKAELEIQEVPLANLNLSSPVIVSHALRSTDGSLYFSVNKTILHWQENDFIAGVEEVVDPEILSGFSASRIKCMAEIPNLGLLIGTYKGLFISRDGAIPLAFPIEKAKELKETRILDLHVDKKGDVWIATASLGLYKFDPKSGNCSRHFHDPNKDYSLGSNQVNTLYEDHSGVLWIGTSRGGLNRLNIEKKPFIHISHNPFDASSLASNLIDGICEDQNGNVWVGTYDQGLSVIEFEGEHYRIKNLKDKLNIKRALSICQDKDGTMYCGSDKDGLISFRWDGRLKHVKRIDVKDEEGNSYGGFSKIFIDSKGIFWLGMHHNESGIIRFDPNSTEGRVLVYTGESEQNPLKIRKIVDICEDKTGDLWVATYSNGVYRVRLNKKTRLPYRFKPFNYKPQRKNTISSNQVFSVTEGTDGNIWIGLFGGGVNRIIPPRKNQKLKIDHFTIKDGLPDDAVYGIVEDDNGYLWISTNNGISKFDPKTKAFTNYDKEDGLQENNFRKYAFHKGPSGKIYFGGINGINIFDPTLVLDNKLKPEVVITGIDIFSKPLEMNSTIKGFPKIEKEVSALEEITLDYSANTFTLNFVGLHYTSPEKNSYKYMLEGYDLDWIFSSSNKRFASYANMKAGDYIFKVLASNSDGVWNSEPSTLSLTVLPPWWKTWWAYLIYAALILGGLLLFRKIIVMKQEYISKLNMEKIEKEKIREINKAKLEFFTNISHEFKTPLTLITGPVEDIFQSKEEFTPRIKNDLSLIKTNADRLLRLINQLIDFRKIEAGHLSLYKEEGDYIAFVSDIVKSFRKIASKEAISLHLSCETESIRAVFDKDKLEKIFYNLLSNAIKHTPFSGMVTLSVRTKSGNNENLDTYWVVNNKLSNYIEFRITNSGEGIKKEDFKKVFERFYGEKNTSKSYESFSSSGIGLALTKGLVQLNEGQLGVQSQAGQTCFIVRLPYEIGKEETSMQKEISLSLEPLSIEAVEYSENYNEVELKDKKPLVLVVDDHREIREFISQILGDEYQVIEATNGKEGYDQVLKMIPDLIISDVMMPEMNGLEFCKLIKTNEITNHIPVILLTAKTALEQRIEGLEVGADSYIPKPFNVKHLVVRVSKLLELRSSLREKFKNNFQLMDKAPSGMKESDLKFIKQAETVIDQNIMEEDFTVETLGQEMAYSRMQLYRKLKNISGLSPNEFIRNYRLKRAANILQEGDLSVTEVLYQVGFSNKSYFTKCFKEIYGLTPKEYSKKYN